MSTPPPVPPDMPEMPEMPPIPGGRPVPPAVPLGNGAPLPPAFPPGPPPVSYPPVVSPQATPGNGTRTLLFGCLGLLAVAGILAVMGGIWVFKKGKEIAENPEQFLVEMAVKEHPEIELVNFDRTTKAVVIKDRKSGETTTISFEDVKNGKLGVKRSDGSSAEVGADGVRVKDKDGNETVMGAGATMPLPGWVPAWEGAHQVVLSSRKTAGGRVTGNFAFTVDAAIDDAAKAYQKQLEAAGFTVDTEEVAAPQGKLFNLTALAGPEGEGRLVKVNCLSQGQGTLLNLEYQGPAGL